MRLHQILEGISKSVPLEKALSYLQKKGVDANVYGQRIEIKNAAENKLADLLRVIGWYTAIADNRHIIIEPRYGTEISDIPATLYHATHKDNLSKIQRSGLVPKTKNKMGNHPERIYAAESLDLAKEFSQHFIHGFFRDAAFLEIDTQKTNNKWYSDPNFPGGFYTLTNIPPGALRVV